MKKKVGGAFGGRAGRGGVGANAHYELPSLADSYASLSCFSKYHSDYTVNISSIAKKIYLAFTYFMSLPKSRYLPS